MKGSHASLGADTRRDSTSSRPSRRPASEADYNLRVVWTLARYVEDRYGAGALREVAAAGGLRPQDFSNETLWVGWSAFEAVLGRARAFMDSDDEFKRACAHRLHEAYGPLRYLLWATTPAQVFLQASRQYGLVSRCGEIAVVNAGRTWTQTRFTSSVPFSRLACLARQGQAEALPTLWGLPPAHLRETRCIAWGDPCCETRAHWYERRRWMPVVFAGTILGAIGLAVVHLGAGAALLPAVLAAAGALLGYVSEVRRTDRLNRHTRQEVMRAFRELAHDEADARRELLEMHARQKEWTRLVEDEMGARTSAFHKLARGVRELHEARATTLLGFSHDLRNPLQIIQMSAEYLRTSKGVVSDVDAAESVRDIGKSVERMRRMLGDLVQVTKAQRDFVTMDPEVVGTAELSESLRGRLRALVHGRQVHTSVHATAAAPERVEIDPLALDRIIDNLLTNAAKYTERGTIAVELDGRDGFLVVRVSDTGRGIAPEALERVFEAGGSSVESRRGDSFGVGLSVVVQLLDQMGGRLEIMSKPNAGTTFWVYLPVRSERRARGRGTVSSIPPPSSRPGPDSPSGPLSRVVSIRKLPA